MKKHYKQTVLSNKEIAEGIFLLETDCEEEFLKWYRPGQFGHIEIPHAKELLMRRPISINCVDRTKKKVNFAYQIMGKGTKILSEVKEGEQLDILMPLGNGFLINDKMQKIWLVGGGIGCAPLLSVAMQYSDRDITAFLGFRSKALVYEEAEFQQYAKTIVFTDDGTYGKSGFITADLEQRLKEEQPDVILSCGPPIFFKSLAKVVGDVPTQVSMEQHMGCGTGGCATCVCKISGENKRVCMEGPVFDMKEVEF